MDIFIERGFNIDIWYEISKYIDGTDLFNLKYTCKYMNTLIDENFDRFVSALLGFYFKINNKYRLFSYQINTIKFIMDRQKQNLNTGLNITMGLGKTLITIACLSQSCNNLVICPKNVISTWELQIKKFTQLKYCLYHQDYHSKNDLKKLRKNFNRYNIIVTSYSKMRSDFVNEKTLNRLWNTIVLDECHNISNNATATSNISMKLEAKHKIIMSGTLIKNHHKELKTLLKFLDIDIRQKKLKEVYKDNFYILNYETANITLPRLNKQIVFVKLDPKHQYIYTVFEKKFVEEYDKIKKKLGKIANVTATLTRLRQICISPYLISLNNEIPNIKEVQEMKKREAFNTPKIRMCKLLINKCLKNNEKVLVLSKFTSALNLLSQDLTINHSLLTGAVKKRNDIIKNFKLDVNVLIANIDIISTGIDLTCANNIIILDYWWNNALLDQSISRIHRLGQIKTCNVYIILVENSVELYMLQIAEDKKNNILKTTGMLTELRKYIN